MFVRFENLSGLVCASVRIDVFRDHSTNVHRQCDSTNKPYCALAIRQSLSITSVYTQHPDWLNPGSGRVTGEPETTPAPFFVSAPRCTREPPAERNGVFRPWIPGLPNGRSALGCHLPCLRHCVSRLPCDPWLPCNPCRVLVFTPGATVAVVCLGAGSWQLVAFCLADCRMPIVSLSRAPNPNRPRLFRL